MKTFAIALAGLIVVTLVSMVPANACPHGYVLVKVHGHWLCRLNAVPPGLKLKLG